MNSFENTQITYELQKISVEDNLRDVVELLNKIHQEELEYLKHKAVVRTVATAI